MDTRNRTPRRWIVSMLTLALAIPAISSVSPMHASAANPCTRTIQRDRDAALAVGENQHVCLKDMVQTGNVTVAPTGSLTVTGSRVKGSIALSSGFTRFKFCDSRVTLAVSATGGGTFDIGSGDGCGGNVIGDALSMSANGSGLTVQRTHVKGAVSVSDTTGTVRISRNQIDDALTLSATDGTSRISGNTILGALTCSDNTPDPVNGGDRNSVGGARTGETCAATSF
jgi:hypothetical protein